jgi:hypothetical protein
MEKPTTDLSTLQDIKKIMERSSRFISLSGWSGIAAGLCALAGAGMAKIRIDAYFKEVASTGNGCTSCLKYDLILIAAIVFLAALIAAIIFTYFKSKSDGVPIWGATSKRLLWNTLLPMLTGGVFILKLILIEEVGLIAPSALIFYGLALINGSKYTMGDIRYLGYAQLLLGMICLFAPGSGLIYWALGFGVFHIIYGILMWRYHDNNEEDTEI